MNSRPVRLLALGAALLAALCSEASAAALDAGFGHDGRVAVELGIFGSRANAVAAQPDGKIVAAGYASSTADRDFMLFRLLPDGSLDPAFNIDGTVTTAVGSFDDEALAVAVQPDGKIIAAGYSSNGENRDFALVRYNSDGSLDRSFGTEGMAVTAVGGSHDEITDIAVQEDGGIIIVGAAQSADGKVAVLARYLADGSPDTAFADQGFSLSVVGVDAQAESVALGKDGRILLSGSYSDGQRRGLMLLGFDSKGQLDKKFGENGIAVPADSSVFSEGYGMVVNEDGTILVAGSAGDAGERDAALFRFTADGRPDSGFEQNGALVTAVSSGDDVLHDVVLTGTAVAATGFETDGEQRKFLLLTYSKNTGGAEENSGSLTMQTASAVVSTGFGGDSDTATALAAVSEQSVVAVGESEAAAGSSAAVSKYMMAAAESGAEDSASASSSAGSGYVWTGAPYEVTRTTAIVPAEVRGISGMVSQRGIAFSTRSNPSLNNSSPENNSGAPVVTKNAPGSEVEGTSANLTLTTDVNAICKYDATAGTAYDAMNSTFSTTGEKTHSQLIPDLEAGKTYTYYARCKNTSSNAVNTADTVISFAVKSGTETDSTKTSGTTGSTATGTSSTTGGSTATAQTPTSVSITDKSTPTQLELKTLHQVQCSGCSDASTKIATLRVTTKESASCKYGKKGEEFEYFPYVEGAGKDHYVYIEDLQVDVYNYDVVCKDTYGNSSKISIEIIATPVIILSENISGEKNSISTDVEADCRYSKTTDKAYADMTDFTTTGGKTHTETFSAGKHTIYVRCKDKDPDNSKESPIGIKITFEINTTAAQAPAADAQLATSDQLINTALRNVGSLFLSTAVAQTSITDTDSTSTAAATTSTTTPASSSSNTSSSSTASETKFFEDGSTNEGGGSGAFSSKLTNLKPGTFFYARAYAISDGVTYYGNEVGFRTADSCFVATAAYGSVFHPAVQVLRDFRNQFLSGNAVSRAAVELYYQVSPALADLVSQHSGLRLAVRLLLLPVTGAAWLLLQFGIWTLLLPAAGGSLILTWQSFRGKSI
ncbi:delta-60 repeat domain-containing protein [Candidatus Electronema sp. JC]|uniref:delta-60 repeat domain-containing protein n=1 Tax=Candidatus Electronema sp. JC TaxID=3401570 RepID=UPI003B432DB5